MLTLDSFECAAGAVREPGAARVSAHGFTLVELVVAVAVLGILLGIGVPSLAAMVREGRIGGDADALVRALHLARSEAIKRAELVTVCPRAANERCGGTDDWALGWIVFVDPTAEDGDGVARVDAADEIVGLEGAISTGNSLAVYGVRASGTAPVDPARYLRFRPIGDAEWSEGNRSGSLVLCDDERGAEAARVLNVHLSGGLRHGRPSGDAKVPNDARNLPVRCTESG